MDPWVANLERQVEDLTRVVRNLERSAKRPPRRGGRTATAAAVLGTALLLSPAFSGASAGAGAGSAKVHAPFQVVGNAGQVIFEVKQAGNGYEADLNDSGGGRAVALVSNRAVSGVELYTVGTLDGKFEDYGGTTELSVGQEQGYSAQVNANTHSAGVQLFDAAGSVGKFSSSLTAGSVLELDTATGKPQERLDADSNGGHFALGNAAGMSIVDAGSTNDANGYVEVNNSVGGLAGYLEAGPTGSGVLKLTNTSQEARVEAGVTTDDRGLVKTYGPGGFNYMEGRDSG